VYDGDLSTLRRNHSDTDEPDGNADLEDVMRRAFGRQASELLGERAESESSTRLGGTGERAGAQNADKPQAAMSS
jgi:hypothetical protein